MAGLLVRGGVRGAAVGFIEYEAAGFSAGLQDIEAEVPRFQYRSRVIGLCGRNEIINMAGFDMDVDQSDMHDGFPKLY